MRQGIVDDQPRIDAGVEIGAVEFDGAAQQLVASAGDKDLF